MATHPTVSQFNLTDIDLAALARNWWLLLIRGVLTMLFGVLAIAWPGVTILTLALLYGAYALVDGILGILAALRGDKAVSTWWLLLVGALSIAAGLVAFVWPGISALALVMLLGVWAFLRGVLEVIGAIALRKEIEHEWLLIASGVLSALFGLWMLFAPAAGAVLIAWLVGIYAIAAGILMIGWSLRLKDRQAVG